MAEIAILSRTRSGRHACPPWEQGDEEPFRRIADGSAERAHDYREDWESCDGARFDGGARDGGAGQGGRAEARGATSDLTSGSTTIGGFALRRASEVGIRALMRELSSNVSWPISMRGCHAKAGAMRLEFGEAVRSAVVSPYMLCSMNPPEVACAFRVSPMAAVTSIAPGARSGVKKTETA